MPEHTKMETTEQARIAEAIKGVQLALCDVARSFEVVTIARDGALMTRCPVDRRHVLVIRLSDEGSFQYVCSTCGATRGGRERLVAALNARLPEPIETVRRSRPVPVTGWVRQPVGAPAVALRRLCDGTVEFIADEGRVEEARAWVQQ